MTANRMLGRILAVYTIVIAVFACWQIVDIYREAHFTVAGQGAMTGPVYTPETFALLLGRMAWVSLAYPIVALAAWYTGRKSGAAREKERSDPGYVLMRMEKHIGELPAAVKRLKRHRRCVRLIRWACVALCAAGSLFYLLDRNHFSSWELEKVMGAMIENLLPWLIIAFVATVLTNICEMRLVKREIEMLQGEKASQRMRTQVKKPVGTQAVRWVLLAVAAAFVVLGVINAEPNSVFAKAIRICTECIGLG